MRSVPLGSTDIMIFATGELFVISFLNSISLNIDEALDTEPFAGLEKEFDKIIGEYYSRKQVTIIVEKIDELSYQKELQFINHGISETLNDDFVEVVVAIIKRFSLACIEKVIRIKKKQLISLKYIFFGFKLNEFYYILK